MVTDSSLEQQLKASDPIDMSLFGKEIDFKDKHPLNAIVPMLVTLSGIVIDSKD